MLTKMATSITVVCSLLNLLCLLLLSVAATTDENSTKYDSNSSVLVEQNVTYFAYTDSFTTLPPDSTTAVTHGYSSTEDPGPPSLSADPLPLSGRLPSPVTDVGRLCPCDEQRDLCDVNCCCDRDCGEEVALFTGCSIHTVSGNKQLCSQDAAHYTLGSTVDGLSELHSSVQKEINNGIFCIQSHNYVEGLSFAPPVLPTDSNFDSLLNQFANFIFGSEKISGKLSSVEHQASSGYQYGDVMTTAGENGERGMFWLPAPGVTTDCLDLSPAAFLQEQSNSCSRRLVLDQDCGTLLALNMITYTNIRLLASKKKDAAVVAVEVASVIQQSLDGTQTEVQLDVGENLRAVLLNPDLCANVVLEVGFVVKYNPAGEIMNVMASLVLGFVHADTLPLEQKFHIKYVQQEIAEEVAVHHSGNPGYVVGLPLVSGKRTADGIIRSTDPRETLTFLRSAKDQDCLHGPHQRSPILFGVDVLSGCTLRLEDAANCSLVSQVLLGVLRGQNYPQYVANFGSSPPNNPMDWVPISNNSKLEEAQTCSIPLSLHLEIEWTKYGSLLNPQAQIVSIKEVLQTNTSDLALLTGGSSLLTVSSSVTFTPVSAAALPGFRALPTLDAKLPFEFFFPFV
ncbi:tectonic-1 isoform X3 [Myripristis murdjan]|uniref:tectonic-1 isoform X3 n=1 Tax=Myripristis murdjan TaxID=586833 RepID=UPI001175ECDE|nr:tectonic-1 isoform X3 [Myripristis murdjan]